MSGAFITLSKIGEKAGEPTHIPVARVAGEFDFYTLVIDGSILRIKIQQNTCKTCTFWKRKEGCDSGYCECENIEWGCFPTGQNFGCVHHRK